MYIVQLKPRKCTDRWLR